MGKPTGFLEYKRENAKVLAPKVRIADFHEFRFPLSLEKQRLQGARCMACGVPLLPVRRNDRRNDFRLSSAQSGARDK